MVRYSFGAQTLIFSFFVIFILPLAALISLLEF